MVECPRCGHAADELHPLPPGAVTKEVVEALGDDEPGEIETCGECVNELMER